jgi:hypothetical protein
MHSVIHAYVRCDRWRFKIEKLNDKVVNSFYIVGWLARSVIDLLRRAVRHTRVSEAQTSSRVERSRDWRKQARENACCVPSAHTKHKLAPIWEFKFNILHHFLKLYNIFPRTSKKNIYAPKGKGTNGF